MHEDELRAFSNPASKVKTLAKGTQIGKDWRKRRKQ
ncbi:hypothetical protein PC119_g19462 [Phytophthora cactorum]|nr:hypothetical protein PC119_g19462 [Phytophthora cactorum]KAG4054456.1 hypothetical protein PC123_g10415 [Phytophthora cactorum]